VLARSWCLSM